jgi:hypothetical protein
MKLQDSLPDTVRVGRRAYKLDLDFRNVLRMIDMLGRDDLISTARDWNALKCVMKHPPKRTTVVLMAVRALLFSHDEQETDHKKLTDFVQDADLIRAAFLQNYGINLYRDKLHWFEFTGLLSCLPDGSRYAEILGIRARPMPKATKYNAEERQWLMKAKAQYAVKMSDKERESRYQSSMHRTAESLLALAKRGGKRDA